MKITDLIIDPRSLGSKLWLVEVSPAYEYRENRKTDTVLGYRYTVAMPEKGLDKINVRIDGDKRMDAPDGYAEVRFDGLEVFIYEYAQTKAYIEKQLTYAGHPNAIFSEDAMKAVHSFSSGIPRLINRACTQSLVYAYQNRRAIIDDRMVQLVLEGEVS